MGLPENHPLATLQAEDGFRIKEAVKLESDVLKKSEDGFLPIRDIIPVTEGRLMGWRIKEHLLSAKARNWPGLKPFEFNGQSIAICGGGPSLMNDLPELRSLQRSGVKVLAINRTLDFLMNLPRTHEIPWIKPWAAILLEPTPQAADYMKVYDGVRYYIGSQCHPATFDKFERSDHVIWHAQSKPELEENLTPEERKVMIPAMGSTCGLRAIMLAYTLGFKEIHLFGMDSCYRDFDIRNGINRSLKAPSLHAYDKPETIHDLRESVLRGFTDGVERTYFGNGNMLAQGDEFHRFMMWRRMKLLQRKMDSHKIIVHGYGLIPDIAMEMGLHADQQNERKAA